MQNKVIRIQNPYMILMNPMTITSTIWDNIYARAITESDQIIEE